MGTQLAAVESNETALMALDYETHHEHAENRMVFDFGRGNKIIVDRNVQKGYEIGGNELINSFDVNDMGIPEFECKLIAFGNKLHPIKQVKNEKRIVQNQKSID